MNISKYWRLDPAALDKGFSVFDSPRLAEPADFVARVRPGEGIVLANWVEREELGRVTALGVCLDRSNEGLLVDWRESDARLRPNASARGNWCSKPSFVFADAVAGRYGLADLFGERFPDLGADAVATHALSPGVHRRLPSNAVPGYVFLIRSLHGFKIGKTANIQNRVRLFGVKCPFPISLEHYAWFDDCGGAERALHYRFHAKRLEGEWFDLAESDIAYIKSLGKEVQVKVLAAA